MLFVATKTKRAEKSTHNCVIVNLKRLPIDISDSEYLAEEILSINEDYSPDKSEFEYKLVDQANLRSTIGNWFIYISEKQGESLLSTCVEEAENKLTSLQNLVKKKSMKIVRGIEHWKDK